MTRLIAIAFAVALASSSEGMPLQPQQPAAQPDEVFTLVREACGPGMQRVNGVCRRNTAVRRACAAGLRLVNGRCIQQLTTYNAPSNRRSVASHGPSANTRTAD